MVSEGRKLVRYLVQWKLRNLETFGPLERATKGLMVSKLRRSHWTRYLTKLEYSNSNYAGTSGSTKDLLSDELLE